MILAILRKYTWIINAVIIVVISYTVALMINKILRDVIETDDAGVFDESLYKDDYDRIRTPSHSRKYYDRILKNNLFGEGSYDPSFDDWYVPDISEQDDARKSSLKIELLATSLSFGRRVAVLKNMENLKIKSYSENQGVDIVTSDEVRIASIRDCEVTIDRGGVTERITCGGQRLTDLSGQPSQHSRPGGRISTPSVKGISKVGGGVYHIEKKMFDELLAKPNDLIAKTRIVPRDDGIKILGLKSESVFFQIGLRNGDVIHQINEVALNNVQNALMLFNDLGNQNQFSIDFTRGGKRQSHRYTVY